MNKSIPERIFVLEDEMNEFLLGKRKQVQIGINQDQVRGLLTYVRRNVVVQPEVDYNKFEKLFDQFCESNKGHHITPHDACMWFWELGLNARKEE